tara:strand:- start:9458 stop:10354 length:897 start_codon:yes stop_codon:yes gene_type:complete
MKTHNLDINMYSLKEVLDLFDLDYDIKIDDLKKAKRKLASIHPDKSKLPDEYFIFYKKAFDIVLDFCRNQIKQNAVVGNEKKTYTPEYFLNKENSKKVQSHINEMSSKEFQKHFNELFDQNMAKKQDPSKNEWFQKEDSIYETDTQVNQGNMGQVFDNMKNNQQQIVKYKGVQELFVNSASGNNLYDDDEDDSYVTSDPFSKLKFDDLRKVHKDESIFSVSESDIEKVKVHNSVESLNRERSSQLNPMQKHEAERLFQKNRLIYQERIMQKEYASKIENINYQEKNKQILSKFLQLKN